MALGGGSWTTQDKKIPGAYINVISKNSFSPVLSDRGVTAMPLMLNWGGESDNISTVTAEDFRRNCLALFGYPIDSLPIKPLRDLYKHAHTAHLYRLNGINTIGAAAASAQVGEGTIATAKCVGVRGNDLTIVIETNVDDGTKFDVTLYLGVNNEHKVFEQKGVSSITQLGKNAWVEWGASTPGLTETAGTPFTGGMNGTVTGQTHQTFLDKLESYTFNALGCPSEDDAVKDVYAAWTRRMRDNRGVKFQCVIADCAADYEGVVNIGNHIIAQSVTEHTTYENYGLVYWVTGVIAGTEINESATNMLFDGDFVPLLDKPQQQLEDFAENGVFALHEVNGAVRVLSDINSLVTTTDTKGEVFKSNQTVRVVDQIANDTAALFNTQFLGKVPNDENGRVSFWSALVQYHKQLQDIRAIDGFETTDITVARGNAKDSIVVTDAVQPTNAMTKLYMTVEVS